MSPRDFLVTPSHFGRFAEVQWRAVAPEDRDALRAAQWQHDVAVLATAALGYRDWSRDDLARELGRERQYAWDRLQGRTAMSLRDLAAVERLLGVQVIAAVSDIPLPADMEVGPDGGASS